MGLYVQRRRPYYDETTPDRLLLIAGFVECVAGLALLLVPSVVLPMLFRGASGVVALMTTGLAGAALLALGIACLSAAEDTGGVARSGTVGAITLYNAVAGLLLLVFAATGQTTEVLGWSAAGLHLTIALLLAASLGLGRRRVPTQGRV